MGVLNFSKGESDASWTDEELTLLETLAEQLGQALEGARLYGETQQRAAREQMIGEAATRMRESLRWMLYCARPSVSWAGRCLGRRFRFDWELCLRRNSRIRETIMTLPQDRDQCHSVRDFSPVHGIGSQNLIRR